MRVSLPACTTNLGNPGVCMFRCLRFTTIMKFKYVVNFMKVVNLYLVAFSAEIHGRPAVKGPRTVHYHNYPYTQASRVNVISSYIYVRVTTKKYWNLTN